MREDVERPRSENREEWKLYWAKVQPEEWFQMWGFWRTEPAISPERQAFLAEHRVISPDIEQCIYPFCDIRLTRADIEWLLATLDDNKGPIDWSQPSHRQRLGLDLRGALLNKDMQYHLDLRGLPLSATRFGLDYEQWVSATQEQRSAAAAQLQGADFRYADLKGAVFIEAHLESTSFREAHLEEATLVASHLEGASLWQAHLAGALLHDAHLEGASLWNTLLVDSQNITIQPADLYGVFFNAATRLNNAFLGRGKQVIKTADIRWQNVNLAVVSWQDIRQLGDETQAREQKYSTGKHKERSTRITEFEVAVRANRQIAVTLREQGINEPADYFAYRALVCQRTVFRFQRKFGKYLWYGFLDLLAGHGYRPLRSFLAYLLVIVSFGGIYLLLGGNSHPLSFPEAIVVSMTAFHGRGFFSGQFSPADPQAYVAAIEAFIGLIIEVSFIATFTQRYFGK